MKASTIQLLSIILLYFDHFRFIYEDIFRLLCFINFRTIMHYLDSNAEQNFGIQIASICLIGRDHKPFEQRTFCLANYSMANLLGRILSK